jgi:hypothetical protein
MAAPQRGQCQRVELSEGTWHVPVSAGAEEWEASSCRHSTRLEARAIHQKPEVPDAHESFGEHVQKEAT